VDDKRQVCRRVLPDAQPRHRHADTTLENTRFVVRRKQNREQVTKKRDFGLLVGSGAHEVMRTAKRRRALAEIARHFFGRRVRAGRDDGEGRGDHQKVFDPVAHLAGEQLLCFFGLFSPGDVEENSEHMPTGDVGVRTLASGGNPVDLIPDRDAEVDLISAHDGARGRERSPDTVPVRRENPTGKILKGNLLRA
jgi:hypothetical protein